MEDDDFNPELNGDGDGDGDAYFRNLPPGFRFQPTNEELTKFYLEKKLLNRELPRHRIFDVNIYEHHPKTLSETYERIREDGWYFFTSRNKKYPNGSRPDRAAPGGFWKPTGTGKSIPSKDNEMWIRKSLDFYDGKHDSPKKSEWKMHEFTPGERNVIHNSKRTADGTEKLDEFVLCRIYANRVVNNKTKKNDEGKTSGSSWDKPASTVSNSESSSDHNNIFSTLVMIDEDKLNSTTPARQGQEYGKQVWYDNNTSYIENPAQYQAHPMNNGQNSSFTLVVDEDNKKIHDHSYNLLPDKLNSITPARQGQESGKQVWYDNNTSYIENPAQYQAHPMNNDQNSSFTLAVDEDNMKIHDHSYNLLPFNSAAGTSHHDFVPKQESGKQVWYGNNTYIENPARDRAHPMNNEQHMILSSVHPNDMMNQLAQPSMVSQDFTDDYYMNTDFLRDTFLADFLPRLDEEDDEKMWLDNNRPK